MLGPVFIACHVQVLGFRLRPLFISFVLGDISLSPKLLGFIQHVVVIVNSPFCFILF